MSGFQPMLAERKFPDLKKLPYPMFGFPKIDGVRAVEYQQNIVGRKLEVFPNAAAQQFSYLRNFDGELTVGNPLDEQVRNITSGMLNRKQDHTEGLPLTFHVFDLVDRYEPLEARLKAIELYAGEPNVRIVPHVLLGCEDDVLAYEGQQLALGYEGLILRLPKGPYKYGRSTMKEGWMLKLKRFLDAEARVLRVNEEMKNTNRAERNKLGRTKRSSSKAGKVGKGRAGELECVGINGTFKDVEFVVPLGGAGDKGKKWWWEVGKPRVEAGETIIVTYKYFPKGTKDKPLLTTYVGVREGWDR